MAKKNRHPNACSQRIEKVVNLDKHIPLHAGQISRNRGEFRFLASGSCTELTKAKPNMVLNGCFSYVQR